MQVFETKNKLKTYFKDSFSKETKIGFVATMGALHEGHLSLINTSNNNNTITIASIFVNPTQFDKKEDLEKYPRTVEKDLLLLKKAGCDIVFIPSVEEIYAQNIASEAFDFDGLEHEMEGQFRTGHFDGVGTIVKAFFEIIEPTNAYFGEKDFQQLQIIKKMVKKTGLPVSVVGCPIYRESNGLAMSSRNERLTKEERTEGAIIHEILQNLKEKITHTSLQDISEWVSHQFDKHPLFELEYFTIADEETLKGASEFLPKKQYRAFIAVFAGSVRLIDNMALYN